MAPTPLESDELERTASVSRFVYNWSLGCCKSHYEQYGKSKPWGELSAELTQLKKTEKWLYDFDSQMIQQALADLKRAYINFFEGRARFPKFKRKRHGGQSFRIPQRVRVENRRVYVPTLGWIKIRQSEEIEFPTRSATFKRTATGKWFVILVSEFDMPDAKVPVEEDKTIGYDMVLEPPNFLAGSEGSEIPAPRYFRARERKLRRAQRRLSRRKLNSRNRAKARKQVARVHERTANLRQNFLHQVSHRIVLMWSVLCFENLSLKSLAKTKHAKSWLDAAFGELLRQVKYKSLWNSKHFVQVGRFFPSSKQCFECGYRNDNLKLQDRQWTCPACGAHLKRDLNAARNIRAEGLKLVAEGYPET